MFILQPVYAASGPCKVRMGSEAMDGDHTRSKRHSVSGFPRRMNHSEDMHTPRENQVDGCRKAPYIEFRARI